MIKINKNLIYYLVILTFSLFLFSRNNVIPLRPVYVRASNLEIFSVEFWTLLVFLIFIASTFIKNKCYLFEKFILCFFASLILTDNVYKFFSVQISDVFGLLAVISYYLRSILVNNCLKLNINFFKKPPGLLMLVTAFACFISLVLPGCFYFHNKIYNGINLSALLTSWLYLARIIILFLFCNILYQASLSNKNLVEKCIKTLLYSGMLGCIVYWVQIGLFTFNLSDVNGIFNDFNFPRAKGVAHEPATFAHSLFFIIILSSVYFKKMNLKILILILTVIATFSLGVYATFVVFLLICFLNMFLKKSRKIAGIAVFLLFLGVFAVLLYHLTGDIFFKMGDKLIYHIQNKIFEQNPVIDSLIRQYPSVKFFGVGLYNSVQPFTDLFEVRNSYSLIYEDTGLFGFVFFMIFLIYNLIICLKKNSNSRKIILFSYIFSFCLITLNVIRMAFFPYLWLSLTLFYDKTLFGE